MRSWSFSILTCLRLVLQARRCSWSGKVLSAVVASCNHHLAVGLLTLPNGSQRFEPDNAFHYILIHSYQQT
ncbi:hypothetical protein CC79DRAFT_1328844 [Sarocladium strictum]